VVLTSWDCTVRMGDGRALTWVLLIVTRVSGRSDPPATREVVLTSWDGGMSDCQACR
jgi:hypothetical protein